jgi:predicted dehydrogenase
MKGTWKDVTGNTFDLGPHVIDQALVLFGRPSKVTAFTDNVRNVGNPDIDDSVSHRDSV